MHHCQQSDRLGPLWAAGPSPCPRKGWHHAQRLIRPFTARFHLLLFSANPEINRFLFPLTRRLLAEMLLAALPSPAISHSTKKFLGHKWLLSLLHPSSFHGLARAWCSPSRHLHLRNYGAPAYSAVNKPSCTLNRHSLWASLVPETFLPAGYSVWERKNFKCLLRITVLNVGSVMK